ncbi:MAG TPA: aminoacetone oxidase family FAD-binding enzyme [Vicinamibacterales bacterium]|nr:aminoacetone oxidase family FAD-binding enzyme [Vicinamibacterales bacterium]
MRTSDTADVVIVGAGAAGLAAAVFCARAASRTRRVICIDSAKIVGAKILVSGGSRCNVTNRVVTERDFWGGDRRVIRDVLRAFPAPRAIAFFEELGVVLREEEDGKLFPVSNRAHTVLHALISAVTTSGAELHTGCRISGIQRADEDFALTTTDGRTYRAPFIVLATGGRSLPKTGSDGTGYAFARAFGHGYVETTPALVPLVLDDSRHTRLAGVAHPADVIVRSNGAAPVRLTGSMLWTHFGVSGPVVLNASRHWLRSRLEGHNVTVAVSVVPGETFASLEQWLTAEQQNRARALVRTVVATRVPAAVADLWTERASIDASTTLSHLTRDDRRRLIHALLETPLEVRDSRGYNYAEVTAGGIPLSEVDPTTMESRVRRGLYLIGEMLDVDGRIGGFNFQWAWSSAWVAASAIGRRLRG